MIDTNSVKEQGKILTKKKVFLHLFSFQCLFPFKQRMMKQSQKVPIRSEDEKVTTISSLQFWEKIIKKIKSNNYVRYSKFRFLLRTVVKFLYFTCFFFLNTLKVKTTLSKKQLKNFNNYIILQLYLLILSHFLARIEQ